MASVNYLGRIQVEICTKATNKKQHSCYNVGEKIKLRTTFSSLTSISDASTLST